MHFTSTKIHLYKNPNKKGWLYVEEINSRDISSGFCINWWTRSSGFKNLPSSWNDRISSVSTASPSASYSTTLWEHTSTQGYGKGVVFKHADWYGKTANLAPEWNDKTSAIDVKK